MKHVNLRLPDDLNDKLKEAAARDDRSVNSYLVALIRRTVEQQGAPDSRRESN
ncbi:MULTISPECIES: Arc family DNA-binding protein [unclassified Nocardiopsis]|uniref:Arc family DNA-binding protein n=1 Tax=Nocardiopsis TaxID=2013 RepID=UPI00387B8DA6